MKAVLRDRNGSRDQGQPEPEFLVQCLYEARNVPSLPALLLEGGSKEQLGGNCLECCEVIEENPVRISSATSFIGACPGIPSKDLPGIAEE